MPNHPHATRARNTAGTFAPARRRRSSENREGNAVLGARVSVQEHRNQHEHVAEKTVNKACFQFMPPAIMPLASMYVGMFTLMEIQRAA